MNVKDAIRTPLEANHNITKSLLSDLSDADLLVRPVPGANHIAWQLGHLIVAETHLAGEQLPGASYPQLPAGFTDTYGSGGATKDGPAGFLSKAEYLALFNKARAVSLAELEKLSDANLDRPTVGPMAKLAPTLGNLFLLVANHTMMHTGQFTVVRRKLGKPVLF